MPELVACPSCGCRTQVLEVALRTRCPGCGKVFEVAEALAPPVPESVVYRLRDEAEAGGSDRPAGRSRTAHGHPLCPACDRPVPWSDPECGHCGYRFERVGGIGGPRRDSLPHRGGLIHLMGVAALYAGAAGLCVGPLGLAASLGLGVPAAWMASHDLERMRTEEVDPGGKCDTEMGRHKAFMGMVLGCLLGGASTLWLLSHWM